MSYNGSPLGSQPYNNGSGNHATNSLQLTDYKVEKILGSGGDGIVFAVCHKQNKNDKSAIKVVELSSVESGQDSNELKEVRSQQIVSNHPCIITMFDYCIDDDGSGVKELLKNYPTKAIKEHEKVVLIRDKLNRSGGPIYRFLAIRMELMEENLLTWMQKPKNRLKSTLIEKDAKWELLRLRIFRQILHGISHIHAEKIIHRDLKVENVFVDKENKVKIGDFGSSVHHADYTKQLTHSSKQGTPLYWAPEMPYGRKYGPEVDIYPLGLIFAELLFDVDESERYRFIDNIKLRVFPDTTGKLICDIAKVQELILNMIDRVPQNRISLQTLITETGIIVQNMNQLVSP